MNYIKLDTFDLSSFKNYKCENQLYNDKIIRNILLAAVTAGVIYLAYRSYQDRTNQTKQLQKKGGY